MMEATADGTLGYPPPAVRYKAAVQVKAWTLNTFPAGSLRLCSLPSSTRECAAQPWDAAGHGVA